MLLEDQALCFYALKSNVHDSSNRREKGKRDSNYDEQKKIYLNELLSEAQALCFWALESNIHDSSNRVDEGKRQYL